MTPEERDINHLRYLLNKYERIDFLLSGMVVGNYLSIHSNIRASVLGMIALLDADITSRTEFLENES